MFTATVLLAVMLSTYANAEKTLHLGRDGQWKNSSDEPNGKFLLAASKIKQVIATGDIESALQQLSQIKADYPDITGPDLDFFMDAELLYAQGKWAKAVIKYDELLDTYPDSWLYDSALERNFSTATAFLTGEKRIVMKFLKLSSYEEGENIMHSIADRTGDAPIAKRALEAVAKSYETRGKYLDAYEAWADISSRWPTGKLGKDSLLQMAHALHSAYRSPKYDQSSLQSARSYYRNFKLRYPQDKNEYQIDEKINMIDEQLAYKQFKIGEYYDRTNSPQAANIYYQYVIDNWPDSTAAKMATEAMQSKKTTQEEKTWKTKFMEKFEKLFLSLPSTL